MNFYRRTLSHIKTRACLKYFVNDCLWKQFFASNSPQTPSNLISLTIVESLRPFTRLLPKTRATKWQKSATICLILPEALKYWVGVQQGQSYLMGRRCLCSLG